MRLLPDPYEPGLLATVRLTGSVDAEDQPGGPRSLRSHRAAAHEPDAVHRPPGARADRGGDDGGGPRRRRPPARTGHRRNTAAAAPHCRRRGTQPRPPGPHRRNPHLDHRARKGLLLRHPRHGPRPAGRGRADADAGLHRPLRAVRRPGPVVRTPCPARSAVDGTRPAGGLAEGGPGPAVRPPHGNRPRAAHLTPAPGHGMARPAGRDRPPATQAVPPARADPLRLRPGRGRHTASAGALCCCRSRAAHHNGPGVP